MLSLHRVPCAIRIRCILSTSVFGRKKTYFRDECKKTSLLFQHVNSRAMDDAALEEITNGSL